MTNLEGAIAMSGLRAGAREPIPEARVRTAEQITEALFAEADDRGTPYLNTDPVAWRRRWLASRRFYLMEVPISCVAMPCKPKTMNLAYYRIDAATDKPILVDINKPGVGRTESGYVPPITVIDGKHRFYGASTRGATHILAWVGELAAERIRNRAPLQDALIVESRRRRRANTPLDRAMELSGASTVEPLHHILGRELSMDPVVVRKMVADYTAVHARGHFGALKDRMNAVSPPGWSKTVEKMKNHPEIDNPFALAWHMHDQGYRPKTKEGK